MGLVSIAQQPEKALTDEKYPRTLILIPDPEELSTPTGSRHTTCLGAKSWCLAEKIKKIGQNQAQNMDRTMQELQHIGSKRDLRPKIYKVQTLTTRDCKGPQTNMRENVGSIKT